MKLNSWKAGYRISLILAARPLILYLWSGRRGSNPRQPAWKAGTLPTELLPQNRIYFSPKNGGCKGGVPASSKTTRTDLSNLVEGYRLCAKTEGKSPKTIVTVTDSAGYLERFLNFEGYTTDVAIIGPHEIRAFILYLQEKKCYSEHPFTNTQEKQLSPHTINCYVRSIRAFWSWLVSEGITDRSPFEKVKVPGVSRKVVSTFSDPQIQALLVAIDTTTPEGFRDYTIVLTLLDTALRVSELTGIRMENLWLKEGALKVMGKGGKERLIPIGKQVQRLLWRYTNQFRPEPVSPRLDFLFLTADGAPMTRNRIEKRMIMYGRRAGIKGVRVSPHTLRHSAAVRFLRNGGDVFSLQRLLGHSTLQMTRHYCELTDVDVKRAHLGASPVDNLVLKH